MKQEHLAARRVEHLLPRRLGPHLHYAPGVAAGDWIFGTGLGPYALAEAGTVHPKIPLQAQTLERRQAVATFDLLQRVVESAGMQQLKAVRLDQYYTTPKAVDAYHQERMIRFAGRVPPSTSMLMRDLSLGESVLDIQAMAVRGARAGSLEYFDHPELSGPASSGFCAAVRSGEFVFVPGFTPSAKKGSPSRRGIAPEATMPDGSLWKGTPIELETRYLIEQKLAPALELAGASLATMVKAQVYLTDASDTLGFLRVWSELVGDDGPALTIIPSPAKSIALEDARIEVNALALTTTAASKIRKIDAGLPRWYACAPNAVQAGDLLLLSGVPPIDQHGQVVHHMLPQAFANFEDLARSQAAAIAQRAATLAAAAGSSLSDTVRLMFFTNRLSECSRIVEGWQDIAPRQPWPVSFIGATPPHLPFGCELQADIWIYCPQQGETT